MVIDWLIDWLSDCMVFSAIFNVITPLLRRRGGYTVFALSVRPSITLFSATMHHSHSKLGMVLWLRVLHVTYRIQVHQLSTSCFTTSFIFRYNMVTWQISATCCGAIFTHYHTTNFRLFQTERVCRQQFQIWQKWQKVILTGRKHCGKKRNCSFRAISPFPTVFSKGFFPRGVKRCCCVGMG